MLKVLIADDEEAGVELVRRELPTGYAALIAFNANQAVAALSQFDGVDLAFIDLNMPGPIWNGAPV